MGIWYVFEQTADGWKKIDDKAYTVHTAVEIARGLWLSTGRNHCINTEWNG